MRIAIYGRDFNNNVLPFVQQVFDTLAKKGIEPILFDKFYQFTSSKINFKKKPETFSNHQDIRENIDVLLSLGGDGTLLDTVTLICDSGIPVLGINFGRLGFLASVNKDDIDQALCDLIEKRYTLDARSLLSLESDGKYFANENYALNDVTIHKRDTSAMIIIHAYLNGEFLNSYWADGLIVATPTGSTAYNLSCGGPIVFPRSGNFIVTPISPHNLNVRPIVLSDATELAFEVEGRASKFLLSCDSRTEPISSSTRVVIRKATFRINLVRLHNETYLSTLRNKLLWGIDTRNY